jgi:hypothetical protein
LLDLRCEWTWRWVCIQTGVLGIELCRVNEWNIPWSQKKFWSGEVYGLAAVCVRVASYRKSPFFLCWSPLHLPQAHSHMQTIASLRAARSQPLWSKHETVTLQWNILVSTANFRGQAIAWCYNSVLSIDLTCHQGYQKWISLGPNQQLDFCTVISKL